MFFVICSWKSNSSFNSMVNRNINPDNAKHDHSRFYFVLLAGLISVFGNEIYIGKFALKINKCGHQFDVVGGGLDEHN